MNPILSFMTKYTAYKIIGYVIKPTSNGYGVFLVQINENNETKEDLIEIIGKTFGELISYVRKEFT